MSSSKGDDDSGATERQGSNPGARPDSPCNRICTLDDRDVCIGCCRTLDEIVAWAGMSADQQWSVVAALPARRRRRELRAGLAKGGPVE